MFVDNAEIIVQAGNGGNGAMSFRHEKFIDRGGPDGGDGGKGGDVIFLADERLNTLVNFRHRQELKAENGGNGSGRKKHGKNGADLVVGVPVGTIITVEGKLKGDLTTNNQKVIIALGGDGGFGNAHFISSTRQAPRVAELGEKGEHFTLKLELKLLADVGLVGLPNAGKSTFLSVVTNARPEIADYPFTTLTPHLGVAEIDGNGVLIADIPGLIEGASQGKGLGDKFLKHVERTGVLLHLIDAWSEDISRDYQTIRKELLSYSPKLAKRRSVVVLSKIDGLSPDELARKRLILEKITRKPILAISSVAHDGLNEVLRALNRELTAARKSRSKPRNTKKTENIIRLDDKAASNAWSVSKKGAYFVVSGEKIEKFARRTDFNSAFGRERLIDIMRRMGIMHELERRGIKPGDQIKIAGRKLSY